MVQLAFTLYAVILSAVVAVGVTVIVYQRRLRKMEAEHQVRKSDDAYRAGLEARLLHAQKLEALGRLTTGVVHDFNNLLMVISGCVRTALSRLDAAHPARSDLQQIEYAVQSGISLTWQLTTFSRESIVRPTIVDLNETVGRLHPMLRRVVGERIEFVVRRGAEVGHVEADASQMEQVIMNLVVNASHAMPEGGTLTIETSAETLDDRFAREHELRTGGEFVKLSVSDTGVGMSPDVQAKIFEPFFTTKPPTEGTGIGLATVNQIVRGSSGCVVVDSTPGQGTTFTVYLPRVERAR